jgi:hypothetical protein
MKFTKFVEKGNEAGFDPQKENFLTAFLHKWQGKKGISLEIQYEGHTILFATKAKMRVLSGHKFYVEDPAQTYRATFDFNSVTKISEVKSVIHKNGVEFYYKMLHFIVSEPFGE